MNADDRLSLDPLGRVEGRDGIVEGSHGADACPQPTIPDPLDGLTQLGAIGYDDEVDSRADLVRALVRRVEIGPGGVNAIFRVDPAIPSVPP